VTATALALRSLAPAAGRRAGQRRITQVLAAKANPTTLRLTSAGPVAQAGKADVIWL
jgi:hypothetical protein